MSLLAEIHVLELLKKTRDHLNIEQEKRVRIFFNVDSFQQQHLNEVTSRYVCFFTFLFYFRDAGRWLISKVKADCIFKPATSRFLTDLRSQFQNKQTSFATTIKSDISKAKARYLNEKMLDRSTWNKTTYVFYLTSS